ncbi:hypothetical protein BT67DRAFT_239942 [Trichocladium antarcticum]|uniref:Uncharacterized protein n=1 Tax=Trichocladium antarcticum TaxID=1450529 RepID=A0AAN6UCS7_9PEZI|nr:hypothetical protein BT67DRAFT_239942 [Trichocladium antarcticum]
MHHATVKDRRIGRGKRECGYRAEPPHSRYPRAYDTCGSQSGAAVCTECTPYRATCCQTCLYSSSLVGGAANLRRRSITRPPRPISRRLPLSSVPPAAAEFGSGGAAARGSLWGPQGNRTTLMEPWRVYQTPWRANHCPGAGPEGRAGASRDCDRKAEIARGPPGPPGRVMIMRAREILWQVRSAGMGETRAVVG